MDRAPRHGRWIWLAAAGLCSSCACSVGRLSDDAGLDTPAPAPPPFDCLDPSTWTAAVARELPLSALEASHLCDPIDRSYVALSIDGRDPTCVRVHASDLPSLPVGTHTVESGGVVIGLSAPASVDLEIRRLTFSFEERRWVVVQERGTVVLAHTPLTLERPPRALLDGAYADDEDIRTTRAPFARGPHFGAAAIADVAAYYGIVARPDPLEPPLLRLISPRPADGLLEGASVEELPEPFAEDDLLLHTTGLFTAGRFVPVDQPSGRVHASVPLPGPVSEIGPTDRPADSLAITYFRSGSRLYRARLYGIEATELTVSRVMRGGCFLDADGALIDEAGDALGTYDTAIGPPLACHRGTIVGAFGIAAITRTRVLGERAVILPQPHEGRVVLVGPHGAWATERANGTSRLFVGHECP